MEYFHDNIDMLIDNLSSDDSHIREFAATCLSSVIDDRNKYKVIELLKSGDSYTKCGVITALSKIENDNLFEPILIMLKDNNAMVRFHAAKILGEMKRKEAVDALYDLTKDSAPAVRGIAVESIIHIVGDNLKSLLTKLLNKDDEFVCIKTLEGIKANIGELDNIIAELTKSDNELVKQKANELLYDLANKR